MRNTKLWLIAPLLVASQLAACQREAAPADTEGQLQLDAAAAVGRAVSYTCDGSNDVVVTYDEERLAHITIEGQTHDLMAVTAVRGVAYADDQLRWNLVQEDGREVATLTKGDGTVRQCSRPANTAAPAPALTACRADQIEATAGEIDAGMGHRNMPVTVSLKGPVACNLPQWPQLALLPQSTGKGIKIEQTTDSYFVKTTGSDRLTLEPGQSVQFYIGWGVIPHEGDGEVRCPELNAWSVKAPGGGELTQIDTQIQACGSKLTISPFTRLEDDVNAAPKPS